MKSNLFFLSSILWLLNIPLSCIAQNCGNISLDDISNPGPYSYLTMDQSDGLRNGPAYGNATVYYPTNTTMTFPTVAIVPGFFSTQSSVAAWGPFLASHGIVSIIIDTNSLFDQPSDRAEGLLDALETINQENSRVTSPLFGLIDNTRFAVMGWSMGGGGAQLAAVMDPSLKAVIGLCPWLNTPIASDLNHSVPVLILSGEVDAVAPPVIHADLHYDLTPSTTDKMLFEVTGGDHSIANDPANVQGEIGEYGLAWLRYNLLDDQCHCPLVLTSSMLTSKNETNIICPDAVDCPVQLTQFHNLIADGIYKATEKVISMGIVASGGTVVMKAEESIYLDYDFTVEANVDFEATIEGCQ